MNHTTTVLDAAVAYELARRAEERGCDCCDRGTSLVCSCGDHDSQAALTALRAAIAPFMPGGVGDSPVCLVTNATGCCRDLARQALVQSGGNVEGAIAAVRSTQER